MKKQLTAFMMSVLLMFSSAQVYAQTPETTETPSPWARIEVYKAMAAGISDAQTASFQQPITPVQWEKYLQIINEKLGTKATIMTQDSQTITRGEVIASLYSIAKEALAIDKEEEPIAFFTSNNFINGRTDGNYALEDACTTEEAILFADRLYEWVALEKGMGSQGAFWKVSDTDNTIYLLGTIHAADSRLYPLSREIMDAFEDSENLAVELNMLNLPKDMAQIVQKYGVYTDGKTLKEAVGEETYAKVNKLFTDLGMPEQFYQNFKPWYVQTIITALSVGESHDFSVGVDLYLLQQAVEDQKNIIELETMELQLAAFDSYSDELALKLLNEALSGEAGDTSNTIDILLDAWKAGDIDALSKNIVPSDPDALTKEYLEKLITIRNKGMVNKVEDMLRNNDKEDFFVAVGTFHMLEDEGIVKELEKLGYTVELVKSPSLQND